MYVERKKDHRKEVKEERNILYGVEEKERNKGEIRKEARKKE